MSLGRDMELFIASQVKVFFFFSFFFVWFCFFPSRIAADSPEYAACSTTACAGIPLYYPFSLSSTSDNGCGFPGLSLTCQEKKAPLFLMTPTGLKLIVKDINYKTQTIKLAIDPSLLDDTKECLRPSRSITLFNITNDGDLPLNFASNSRMGTFFYGCSTEPSSTVQSSYTPSDSSGYNFTSNLILGCSSPNGSFYSYAFSDDSFNNAPSGSWSSCQATLSFPVVVSPSSSVARDMGSSLSDGFDLLWAVDSMRVCADCVASGGRCGHNITDDSFLCFCRQDSQSGKCNQPAAASPSSSGKLVKDVRKKAIVGVSAAAGGFLLAVVAFFIWHRLGKKRTPSSKGFLTRSFSSSKSSSTIDVESRSFHQRCFGPVTIFTYKELEEATNNFSPSNELGDGGFGAVYLGKLHDGRKVAVKKLYENNYKRVEQFMNEIAILSGIRHPNLVGLYGCTSRHSRELLLVYEYVNNGTVGDHIHGMRSSGGHLTWKVRLNIAVETAEALAHLHRLEPPIIHRDVKTNNILLDRDFHVKVADFGLSRFFPLDVTHVSTAPQGTPGYVDPDYHKCYQLTEKSDVYSFGVVLAELISSLAAVDIRRHRHEINLANMAVNMINNYKLHEFVDSALGFETDEWVKRTVSAVAELTFRCLVQEREIRPTMKEVAEALKQIQSGECESEKTALSPEKETGALLKPSSPKSVTDKWPSHYTTPDNSG